MSDERTHYDALGVARDADAAQISRAWRRRTRKAGPGSPEFARINEAADTLLDPTRRAAYDASLPAPEPEQALVPAPASTVPGPASDENDPTGPSTARMTGETAEAQAPAPVAEPGAPTSPWRRVGVLAPLAVLTVLALVSVIMAVTLTHHHHRDQAIASARLEAPTAAQRALAVMLAYDYTSMTADLSRDLPYMTAAYQKRFTKSFRLLTQSKDGVASAVEQTKSVVTVSISGAAVMDAAPTLVHVLVFADQTSVHHAGSNKQECPCVLQDRIEVTMVKQDGKWLVDNLQTG